MRFAEICKHGGVRGHLSTSQLALPLTTINGFTTMAPNLALATHELTQNIINSKLQGDKVPNDDDVAKIGLCTARTVRYHRSNMHLYRSTKAPSNGAGRPRTITPPMLTALCAQLAVDPCMRLRDMATFLGAEFDVDVTRFSISRALRDAGWSKKATQNVARERSQDLRDEYMYEISYFPFRPAGVHRRERGGQKHRD